MESETFSADSQLLARRLVTGDAAAADAVFARYLRRLTALARARLAPQVGRRVDPEDAVQSAFLSFFLAARTGRFTIERSGDLWRLLATITARKVSRLTAHHQAAKRSVRREAVPAGDESLSLFFPADDCSPQPAEAALMAEELVDVMQSLPLDLRQVLQLRLQDAPIAEIATALGRTERTVRRKLEELRERLAQRFESLQDSNSAELSGKNEVVEIAKPTISSHTPLPASSSINGLPTIDYRDLVLLAHLGTGGMGRVYRAWQRSSGRHVAVKVLKKSRQRDPLAVARFLAEIETVARFDHPGITHLYGLGRMPGGGYFFVMQLVEGSDLQQRLDQGEVSLQESLAWMRQIVDAIAFAASHGFVHCDLKPSNVLLDHDGRAVVSDFGFAIALSESASPLGGTWSYLAPELTEPNSARLTPAVDVWGLGAILYAMMYRRTPRAEQTIGNRELDFPGIDSPLTAICRRCLAVNPRDRYATASDLSAALAGVAL